MNAFKLDFYVLIIILGLLIPEYVAMFDSVKNILSRLQRTNMTMDENDDTFLEIIIHRAKRDEPKDCDEKEINKFLVDMGISNYDAIIFLLISNELDDECKKMEPVLSNARDYLGTCRSKDDEHINLILGAEEFMATLCDPDTLFRKELDAHTTCINGLKEDLSNCAGGSDFGSEKYKKDICCAYALLTNCIYVKVDTGCGDDAARSLERAASRVISNMLPIFCATSHQNCDIPDQASQLRSNVILVSLTNVFFYIVYEIIHV